MTLLHDALFAVAKKARNVVRTHEPTLFLKRGIKIFIFMCELFDKTEANEHDVLGFYFEFF